MRPESSISDPAQALAEAFMEFRKSGFRHHSPGELGRTEFAILLTLDQHSGSTGGGMRVSDLANLLASSPPTMTQSTGSLTKLGYVERLPDPVDRRVIRIALTQKGRDKLDERKRFFQDYCTRMADYLGAKDALTLAVLLKKTAGFMKTEVFCPNKETHE